MDLLPNLCYTLALDRPGEDVHRRMARLLVTSLIRTKWHGRITVFRNTSKAILIEGHPNVQEIVVDADPTNGWDHTVSWKYRVRDRLDLNDIDKVLFLDCDCIALRGINQLMLGEWDLCTAAEADRIVESPFNGYLTDHEMVVLKESPGLNSGTIGVRAKYFPEVMTAWEKIDTTEPLRRSRNRDQHAWNRVVLDTHLRHRTFSFEDVQFPFLNRAHYLDYRRAAIVHAAARTAPEKLSLLFGLWMEAFGSERLEEVTAP